MSERPAKSFEDAWIPIGVAILLCVGIIGVAVAIAELFGK